MLSTNKKKKRLAREEHLHMVGEKNVNGPKLFLIESFKCCLLLGCGKGHSQIVGGSAK